MRIFTSHVVSGVGSKSPQKVSRGDMRDNTGLRRHLVRQNTWKNYFRLQIEMSQCSKVELSNGQLVLNDHQGQKVWSNSPNGNVTPAAMLVNGNFVLLGSGSAYKWESFAQPTDNILPSQTLLRPSITLSSCESETNYSSRKFRLRLQDGNLELYTVALPSILYRELIGIATL